MSEEERKEIATVISSILTSTTRRMTIKQLNNDFIQTEGYRIPHEKFGCYNLEQFLRSLNDKVQVNGTGIHAEVQVLISEKTAHINELIAKQKTPRSKLSRLPLRRRNFYPPSRRNFTNYSCNDRPENRQESLSPKSPEVVTLTERLRNDTDKCCKGAIPKQTTPTQNDRMEEIYFSDEESKRNVRVPEDIQENLRRLITKYPGGIMCSSVLEYYRKEFRKCLTYSEYGYRSVAEMCADLRSIFNVVQIDKSDVKLFNKNLPIPEDTLNIVKKLQLLKIKATRETSADGTALPLTEVEDIMRQIHTENVPPDIVEFGIELERQWIDPGTNEQDCIDINIAEIYDPSKFWMILKVYANRLNIMMDDLQIFYRIRQTELYVPPFALKKDMYIACIYHNEYHRARIVDISQKEENTITVYFIDYGTVAVVSTSTVCYLHKQFAELPQQAIRARLAGIYPRNENEQWPRSASTRFLSLVFQKNLVAQIIKIDEERKILDVVLADTTEEDDFFINDALVSMGYACFTFEVISDTSYSELVNSSSPVTNSSSTNSDDAPKENDITTTRVKKTKLSPKEINQLIFKLRNNQNPAAPAKIVPIVRYIHLFPTHMELENGLVPTATQTLYMHQAGLRIEQMYPHYFKDSRTGLPMTMLQTFSDKGKDLRVDYEMEEPYIEEIEGEDDQIALNNEEEATLNADKQSNSICLDWGDVIERVESGSPAANGSNTEIYLQDGDEHEIEQIYELEEDELSSPNSASKSCETTFTQCSQEFQEEKATQTNSIASTQTDVCNRLNAKPNHSNVNNNTNSSSRSNTPNKFGAKLNEESFKLNASTDTVIKDPIRPPPGYDIIPRNTSVTYNYNANPQSQYPYNCVTNQTYINFPVLYPYAVQQFAYNPYATHYYEHYVQSLLQLGSKLNFQQQNLNHNNYTQERCYYPTPPPGHPRFDQGHPNVSPPQPTEYQHNMPTESHTYESHPVQTVIDQVSVNVNTEAIESIPPMITPCRSEVVNDNSSELCVTNNVREEPSREDEKTELNPKKLDTTPPTLQPISISSELSEIESVYEECIPDDFDFHDRFPTITTEDDGYKTNLITSMNIGKLKMHVINHEDDFYFLLAELSKKIFGKALTAFHIRKLIAGSPYIISVVDIRLRTNPELAKELLKYKLITEKELTVDAIPIKYLKDLTTMISAAEEDEDNIKDLLEGVDYFLSKLSLESACF